MQNKNRLCFLTLLIFLLCAVAYGSDKLELTSFDVERADGNFQITIKLKNPQPQPVGVYTGQTFYQEVNRAENVLGPRPFQYANLFMVISKSDFETSKHIQSPTERGGGTNCYKSPPPYLYLSSGSEGVIKILSPIVSTKYLHAENKYFLQLRFGNVSEQQNGSATVSLDAKLPEYTETEQDCLYRVNDIFPEQIAFGKTVKLN